MCNLPFAVPVGVFDSGVGGLSVAREIMALLPAQPIIYLADQVHAPYGQRPLTEIRALSEGIARFLLTEGAGVIVIACNTASAASLHGLREQFPTVPFVGMEPAVKPAVEHTRSGHVGVIATAATSRANCSPVCLTATPAAWPSTRRSAPNWCRWWKPASWTPPAPTAP